MRFLHLILHIYNEFLSDLPLPSLETLCNIGSNTCNILQSPPFPFYIPCRLCVSPCIINSTEKMTLPTSSGSAKLAISGVKILRFTFHFYARLRSVLSGTCQKGDPPNNPITQQFSNTIKNKV